MPLCPEQSFLLSQCEYSRRKRPHDNKTLFAKAGGGQDLARWMGDCRPQRAVRFKGWFPDQQLRSTWELVRNANLGLVNPPNMGVGWELSLGNCRGLSDAGWSLKEAWLLSICIRIEESKSCEWPPLGALGSEFSQGSQVVFCARSENRFLEQPRPSPQLPRRGEGHFS